MIFQNGIKFLLKRFLRRRTRSKDIFAYYWTRFFPRKNKKTIKKFHSYNFTCYIVVRVNNIFVLKKKKIKKLAATREAWHFQISPIIFIIDERKRGGITYFIPDRFIFAKKGEKFCNCFSNWKLIFEIYIFWHARIKDSSGKISLFRKHFQIIKKFNNVVLKGF